MPLFSLNTISLYICLSLAVLGLCCSTGFSLVATGRAALSFRVRASSWVAPPVAEQIPEVGRLQQMPLPGPRAQIQELWCLVDLRAAGGIYQHQRRNLKL